MKPLARYLSVWITLSTFVLVGCQKGRDDFDLQEFGGNPGSGEEGEGPGFGDENPSSAYGDIAESLKKFPTENGQQQSALNQAVQKVGGFANHWGTFGQTLTPDEMIRWFLLLSQQQADLASAAELLRQSGLDPLAKLIARLANTRDIWTLNINKPFVRTIYTDNLPATLQYLAAATPQYYRPNLVFNFPKVNVGQPFWRYVGRLAGYFAKVQLTSTGPAAKSARFCRSPQPFPARSHFISTVDRQHGCEAPQIIIEKEFGFVGEVCSAEAPKELWRWVNPKTGHQLLAGPAAKLPKDFERRRRIGCFAL